MVVHAVTFLLKTVGISATIPAVGCLAGTIYCAVETIKNYGNTHKEYKYSSYNQLLANKKFGNLLVSLAGIVISGLGAWNVIPSIIGLLAFILIYSALNNPLSINEIINKVKLACTLKNFIGLGLIILALFVNKNKMFAVLKTGTQSQPIPSEAENLSDSSCSQRDTNSVLGYQI